MQRHSDGSVVLEFQGEAGRLEFSDDLRAWTALGEITPAGSDFSYTDHPPASSRGRFYRAVPVR